jgi:tetratricopeptide (TPR) repeat protein
VLEILRHAEAFAGSDEEREALAARRVGIEGPRHRSSAPSTAPREDTEIPEEEVRFRQRLSSRPEAERRRLAGLGSSGRAGYLALLEGDFAAAATALQREVQERPEAAAAREMLARAFEGLGHHEEARQQYEAACRRSPERCRLTLEVSRVLRDSLGDGARALARVEEACRSHPASPESQSLHMERVFLLADAGRFAEAIQVLDDLLFCPGLDRGLLLYNRAGLLEEAGRPEEAVSDVAAAIEASPSNPLYLERMADLLFGLTGDLPRALQLLDRALAIDAHDFAARRGGPGVSPDRARLQFKAGRILHRLDRSDEALTRVDEALVVCWDPRVEEALLDLRRSLTA